MNPQSTTTYTVAQIKPYVSFDRRDPLVLDANGQEVKRFPYKEFKDKATKLAIKYLNDHWYELLNASPEGKASMEVVEANQPQFLKDKGAVVSWLEEMNIKNYSVDDETLIVDVAGDVNISNKGLEALPIQFGKVQGNFDCSHNRLHQLIGSPKYVEDFDCSHNKLFNFLFGPKEAQIFKCHDNAIVSFEGLPRKVKELHCEHNRIKALKGLPEISGVLVADCSIALEDIKTKSGASDITLIPSRS